MMKSFCNCHLQCFLCSVFILDIVFKMPLFPFYSYFGDFDRIFSLQTVLSTLRVDRFSLI
jgi:hypothetical protein